MYDSNSVAKQVDPLLAVPHTYREYHAFLGTMSQLPVNLKHLQDLEHICAVEESGSVWELHKALTEYVSVWRKEAVGVRKDLTAPLLRKYIKALSPSAQRYLAKLKKKTSHAAKLERKGKLSPADLERLEKKFAIAISAFEQQWNIPLCLRLFFVVDGSTIPDSSDLPTGSIVCDGSEA